MVRWVIQTALALVLATALCRDARAVGFDTLPDGTIFGRDTHFPGQQDVHVEDGVSMSVENFVLGGTEFFFFAEVGGKGSDAFDTNALSLDNISVAFDFSDVGFAVTEVSFDFLDLGGASNLSVNNETLFVLDPLSSLPMNVASGVTATVDDRMVTLFGPVQTLLVGGQELVIDNVIAIPEPSTGILLAVAGLAAWWRRRTA